MTDGSIDFTNSKHDHVLFIVSLILQVNEILQSG